MSWIDKIKSVIAEMEKENEKETKNETPARAINFEEIPLLLEEKTKKISKKESEIKTRIIDRIKEFEEKLDDGITLLASVDLSKRKEDERLKSIVRENSSLYSSLVLRLSSKLNELSRTEEGKESGEIETKMLLEKIKLQLNEFYKASMNPFQKSTILIGREMENIRRIIKEFSDEMVAIERENESFFKEYESINTINDCFSELKDLEKQEENLIYLSEEQKEKNTDIKNSLDWIEKQIDSIRNSKEYEEDIRQRENKEKETERKIQELKKSINFKELKSRYHTVENVYEIVKKYSSNFVSALIEDKELEFERLLANENQKELLRELRDKLIEPVTAGTETEKKIKSFEDTQRTLKNELKVIESNIEVLNKRTDKILNRKDKLKQEIQLLAGKVL